MVSIRFLPESDILDFEEAVAEFGEIWRTDGERIVRLWESSTGLAFRETHINAAVANARSQSHPLVLRYDNDADIKRATLVHELGHRLLYKQVRGAGRDSFERHKVLFLVLYDVFVGLYGEAFADKAVQWDSALDNAQARYKDAWEWVLGFETKAERQNVFQDVLAGVRGV